MTLHPNPPIAARRTGWLRTAWARVEGRLRAAPKVVACTARIRAAAIKPCPFCGWAAPEDLDDVLYRSGSVWRLRADGRRSYHAHRDRRPGDHDVWELCCNESMGGCGAQMHGDSEAEVVALWNRRAPGWRTLLARLAGRGR